MVASHPDQLPAQRLRHTPHLPPPESRQSSHLCRYGDGGGDHGQKVRNERDLRGVHGEAPEKIGLDVRRAFGLAMRGLAHEQGAHKRRASQDGGLDSGIGLERGRQGAGPALQGIEGDGAARFFRRRCGEYEGECGRKVGANPRRRLGPEPFQGGLAGRGLCGVWRGGVDG